MTGLLLTMFDQLAASRTARRRARNLRAGNRSGGPVIRLRWPRVNGGAVGLAGLVLAGALALGLHARGLAAAGKEGAPASPALGALQPLLGGVRFEVPGTGGVTVVQHGGAALLVASGARAEPALRVDLCTQVLDPARPLLLPLRIGYPLAEAAALARAGGSAPRNVLLARLPRVTLSGDAGSSLKIGWTNGASAAWIGDAAKGVVQRGTRGEAPLGRSGWLVWQGEALRFAHRPSRACPSAGELVVQVYRPDPSVTGPALVQAFAADGEALSLRLAPGNYQVPAAPARGMEDQALFEQLRARGLLRLSKDGLAELAPRDLAAWQAADAGARAPLPGWESVHLDEDDRKLLARLYGRADGAFVREQVRIFNSERRLVAWRVRTGDDRTWQAALSGAPAAASEGLPVAAMRLFARLPEGWAPWTRVAGWDGDRVILSTPALRAPAELLLAGRLLKAEGARAVVSGVCDGRACLDGSMVQHLLLTPEPGAGRVRLEVAPLDLTGLSGGADAAYRHLRLDEGRLAWHALPGTAAARTAATAPVRLADRHGALLWSEGRPVADAGLGPLLGVHRLHAGSVAGMLARLGGTGHEARLSLDLDLQGKAQAALDCIGMRQGQWDGKSCSGGQAPPAGRQAGLVLLDAERGDILAAASGGAGKADPARWAELRDFDRADPARSPLRIPAFQHDGGAHRAPGSTFKVISALGLEQAARKDARLDALLSGMPLDDIDRLAREGGYGFRAASATYPANGAGAHITNFREQLSSARADGGRLGLGQALAHSVNTWFAWTGELSDASLLGQPEGGVPGARALEPGALDTIRPIAGMARRLGFGRPLRLDGGLLPPDYRWSDWDALQASASAIDPVLTRHELRQMAIGLRMQVTPLQMALVAAALEQGRTVTPRLLLELDGRAARESQGEPLGVRLDRIRAGMKGVVERGTAAGAFRHPAFARLRPGLYGKTGTAPAGRDGQATVWFMGWLEPGSLPGQTRPLAFAAFVSHSDATGGGHAAPAVAALLRAMDEQSREQKGK